MKHTVRALAIVGAAMAACTFTRVGSRSAPVAPPAPTAGEDGSAAVHPTGGTGGAAPVRIVGPGAHQGRGEWPVRAGERIEAVLHAGEEQAFIVDLTGGEHLRWTIHGQSEASPSPRACTNWSWAWHEPAGAWMNGGPLSIGGYDRSDPREDTFELDAHVPWSGDFKPVGGRWRFVVSADGNCAEIQYWMTFDVTRP